MVFYVQPQSSHEEFRCTAESDARRPTIRGARPARTFTTTVRTWQRTMPYCVVRPPAMTSIYLDRP